MGYWALGDVGKGSWGRAAADRRAAWRCRSRATRGGWRLRWSTSSAGGLLLGLVARGEGPRATHGRVVSSVAVYVDEVAGSSMRGGSRALSVWSCSTGVCGGDAGDAASSSETGRRGDGRACDANHIWMRRAGPRPGAHAQGLGGALHSG